MKGRTAVSARCVFPSRISRSSPLSIVAAPRRMASALVVLVGHDGSRRAAQLQRPVVRKHSHDTNRDVANGA